MMPIVKTLETVVKARLYPLMVAGAVLAIIVIIALIGGATALTALLVKLDNNIVDVLVKLGAGVMAVVIGWFLLPVFIVLISGMFQGTVIKKVERIYYPDQLNHRDTEFWIDFKHDIRFTVKSLALNLLVIPLYFVGIGFVISVLLNSYLIGREFFEGAAGYHLGKPQARALGQKNRRIVYGGGLMITLLTLLPLVNIFMPIFATVWMVHVYHRLRTSTGIETNRSVPRTYQSADLN